MRISILTIGAIASTIAINSVFADTTVTSTQYVDTTRQATIPAADTNYEANGGGVSVVTYTENAGVLGERGICDAEADENWDCDDDNLVTLDLISQVTNLPRTRTTNKVCTEWVAGQAQTDANCLLWNLTDQTVYGCLADGASCISRSQCCSGMCDGGICASLQY